MHTQSEVLCYFANRTNIASRVRRGWQCKDNIPLIPICTGPRSNWNGITCNTRGVVTQIFPSGLFIVGTLIPELGELSEVTSILLFLNDLSGTIPTSLGRRNSNLLDLNLGANNFSGTIPHEIGRITTLTSLSLFQNNLDGTIPTSFGNLINLKELYLNDNFLTGSVPSSLCNLPKLDILSIAANNFTCYPRCLKTIKKADFGTTPECTM